MTILQLAIGLSICFGYLSDGESYDESAEESFELASALPIVHALIGLNILSFVIVLGDAHLVGLHVWLRSKNLTTYEYIVIQREKAEGKARQSKTVIKKEDTEAEESPDPRGFDGIEKHPNADKRKKKRKDRLQTQTTTSSSHTQIKVESRLEKDTTLTMDIDDGREQSRIRNEDINFEDKRESELFSTEDTSSGNKSFIKKIRRLFQKSRRSKPTSARASATTYERSEQDDKPEGLEHSVVTYLHANSHGCQVREGDVIEGSIASRDSASVNRLSPTSGIHIDEKSEMDPLRVHSSGTPSDLDRSRNGSTLLDKKIVIQLRSDNRFSNSSMNDEDEVGEGDDEICSDNVSPVKMNGNHGFNRGADDLGRRSGNSRTGSSGSIARKPLEDTDLLASVVSLGDQDRQ
eukprot:CAMPEP_0115032998 /NCGR_PEP_ID=MMETSP0216-20121206/39555_1 /TAXON_ID=223996 /ORGANISM="Protocruzia adherens, Strain Boccale" /LENGTH=405 /DNA_ID=CAMNT_0002411131 /DNA_START=439 /DNA_END=1656 /DNA_ORIENTATION=-